MVTTGAPPDPSVLSDQGNLSQHAFLRNFELESNHRKGQSHNVEMELSWSICRSSPGRSGRSKCSGCVLRNHTLLRLELRQCLCMCRWIDDSRGKTAGGPAPERCRPFTAEELQSDELKAGALQHWQTHIAHNTSDDTGFAHDPNWSLINQF